MAVKAGQTNGSTSAALDQVDKTLINFSGQHHLHHVHGFLVGHPQSVLKLGLLADLTQQIVDLGATAVHQHHLDTDQAQQHDIVYHRVLQLLAGHGVAAVLDH